MNPIPPSPPSSNGTDDLERLRLERDHVHQLAQLYNTIVDAAPVALLMVDQKGIITLVNRQVGQLFGYEQHDLLGKPIEILLPERYRSAHVGHRDGFFKNPATRAMGAGRDLYGLRKDGSEVPIEIGLNPLHMGDELLVLAIIVDISKRKQAEEERRRIESQHIAQLQQTQKLESLGILAGGIAHDFNNLLTSILGYADLALLHIPPNSTASTLIGQSVLGARQAAELTKQMLAYSGKGRFVVEPINLSRLVEEMARLLQISISKKCVLKFDLMEDLPTIEADASQMRQVIMNLIINAAEAIGDRSGVIAIHTGVMHCDRAYLSETYLNENLPEGLYVHIEVADNGSGMTEETREKIFDPFFTTKFTGRGLGLSAVLGIVRGHHGAMKCYSEIGRGTTFKVLFPATGLPSADHTTIEKNSTWRGEGTVLVIDDEESVRGLAMHMLTQLGFTVLLAGDGREGVAVFREHAAKINLVLLDMTMPHLDGAETFRELRRAKSDVKTILMSGYNEQTATSAFAGKGLAAFLQKPFQFDDLTQTVRRVLEAPPA